MELREIEKLIGKYDAGETSLAEEEALREYFASHQVPQHLETYRILFGYVEQVRMESLTEKPVLESRKVDYFWTGIAATVILALGLFLYQDKDFSGSSSDLGTIRDQELALQKTKETLKLVSEYMNQGSEDLVYLKELNTATDKFIEK
ncbi:MAG: hypothetical protein WBV11_11475 [Salegentibacter sp.]